MIIDILFIVVGFALLIRGAENLVNGASTLARRLGVSTLLVGLTIVAFGTSMPELVVNVFAAFHKTGDIVIGNILGSNVANIALVLGVAGTLYPMRVQSTTIWREIPFAMLAAVLVYIMANDVILDGAGTNFIGRADGLVLVAFSLIFVYYLFGMARHSRAEHPEASEKPAGFSWLRVVWQIVFGIVILVLGGKFVIDHSVLLATALGVSNKLIGLTVVALGTSMPELVTAIVAAFKKQVDIAVGTIVGSNILNIFWVLGISTTITPVPFSPSAVIDAIVVMFFTALLFVFMFIGKRHELERWQGIGFFVLYVSYVGFLFIQG